MRKLKIALLQILPEKSAELNMKKGEEFCKRAAEMGADIILFPEMFSCGYNIPQNAEELSAIAQDPEGTFVEHFSTLAKELKAAIAITYLKKTEALPQNAVTLFDMNGCRVLDYSKVHTCDFGDEKMLSAGDNFYACTLVTALGEIKVGAMICYDREFPESARILMLKGAEIILVPNACPMEINRLSQLRGRAYENMLCVATCNYPEGKPDCNGHSSVFDGVAYVEWLETSRDTCILEADGREGIFTAELDIDMLRAYRSDEVHGNAYRRPEKYAELLSCEIKEPFIRKDKKK